MFLLFILILVLLFFYICTSCTSEPFVAAVDDIDVCKNCLKECSNLKELDKKSDEFTSKFCSTKCFDACAVKQDLGCEDTCNKAYGVDSNDKTDKICDMGCESDSGLGCRWQCLQQGHGEVCKQNCPDIDGPGN